MTDADKVEILRDLNDRLVAALNKAEAERGAAIKRVSELEAENAALRKQIEERKDQYDP